MGGNMQCAGLGPARPPAAVHLGIYSYFLRTQLYRRGVYDAPPELKPVWRRPNLTQVLEDTVGFWRRPNLVMVL